MLHVWIFIPYPHGTQALVVPLSLPLGPGFHELWSSFVLFCVGRSPLDLHLYLSVILWATKFSMQGFNVLMKRYTPPLHNQDNWGPQHCCQVTRQSPFLGSLHPSLWTNFLFPSWDHCNSIYLKRNKLKFVRSLLYSSLSQTPLPAADTSAFLFTDTDTSLTSHAVD